MKLKKQSQAKLVAKKLKKSKKVKKDLSEVTTDEFFNQDFVAEDSDEMKNEKNEDSDSETELDPKSHKRSLQKLQKTDPEFYQFLKQNDKKLLNFEDSDQEESDIDDDNDDSIHVPNEDLEVASDEDDYEGENLENKSGPTKVNLKLLKIWQEEIQKDKSSRTIKCVTEAFHAALLTVADPDGPTNVRYRVEGSAAFNGVVQLCILYLPSAFKRFLKLGDKAKFEAHKSKRFPKIKGTLKSYLSDLLRIMQNVTSPDILTVLLKHLHQMISYTQSFSSLNKPLLKILLKFWSSGEETVRVVAFLSILHIAMNRTDSTRETLMKTMYIKYVENSKFVSESTSAGINFMRHSLAEIYLLDHNVAYTHAFLYVRQLAIHLRNAVTLKKKENYQAVYNWQFVNSLRFWTELVNLSSNKSMLRSLLYPLVQIIIGTITLISTAQFYPLRFHCCQMLINISKETGVFIPILPYLLEVLTSYDFNKKHKSVTMKPLSLICLLRMSKAQLQENGFKNSVIDNIYQLVLECAAKDSHTICFPDMYVFCIIQLKNFLKKCKVANFCKKMKQLLEKIQENRQFIETERNKIIVDLSDIPTIKNWENTIKNKGTPLSKFYESWYNLHQSHKLKILTQNDSEGDFKLPSLKRSKKRGKGEDFDHDSDLDMPVEEMDKLLKRQEAQKKKKKKQKVAHQTEDVNTGAPDIVKDLSAADWD